MMEYIMKTLIAIVMVFSTIAIASLFIVWRISRIANAYKDYAELLKAELDHVRLRQKRSENTNAFLYELLADIITSKHDEDILYKATNLRVILMIMNMDTNYEKTVNYIRTTVMRSKDVLIHDELTAILQKHKGADVLEEETQTKFEKFMKAAEAINEDLDTSAMILRDHEVTVSNESYLAEEPTPDITEVTQECFQRMDDIVTEGGAVKVIVNKRVDEMMGGTEHEEESHDGAEV